MLKLEKKVCDMSNSWHVNIKVHKSEKDSSIMYPNSTHKYSTIKCRVGIRKRGVTCSDEEAKMSFKL